MAKYLMFVSLFLALTVKAEKYSFAHYQSILDRMMFGRPPSNFDPTKMPSEVTKQSEKELTKEQEQIKSAVHFSIINVTPSGKTAVGFTDNSDPKTPVHYYLKVGESSGGWTLKEADALKAWMKIEKNGIEVELTLGANSATGGGTTSRAASTSVSAPKLTSESGALRVQGGGLLNRKGPSASFAQRRADRDAKRLEEEKRREEEKAKQEAEREEMKASLAEMKDQLAEQRRLREEEKAREKAKAEEEAKAKAEAEKRAKEENEEIEGGEENENDND